MLSVLKFLFNSLREITALDQGAQIFSNLISGSLTGKRLLTGLIFLFELPFMLLFDTPLTPAGRELDLTDYELVFYDEFEGDTLDTEAWFTRGNGVRRGGFNAESQVEVRDGNLVITGEYLENGEYGEGWYAGAVALTQKYKQGYFEIKCICNAGGGFWSAFWIQADHPYDPEISKGGIGGAEIDIFEAMDYDNLVSRNSVSHNIHCSGMQGDTSGGLNSVRIGNFKANNIYKEYNVYGCEWTEDEYIFYINGVESARSTWADGVSTVPEQLIVSLEVPESLNLDKDHTTEYIVDYVKIYQK